MYRLSLLFYIDKGEKFFELKWQYCETIHDYLAAQLACREHKLYYWESNSTAELDFVIMYGNGILPIECKANVHVRAKSLEIFKKKYDIAQSVRVSAKNFGMENGIKSVPLYAAWCI